MDFTININNKDCKANHGETILEVLNRNGIKVPTLCHLKDSMPTGACRMCVVEDVKTGKLITSCSFPANAGMEIKTHSQRVVESRKTIIELLLSNHPDDCLYCVRNKNCELQNLSEEHHVRERKIRGRKNKEKPLIVVITGGSAIAIPEIEEIADAILFVWYPGEQGGNALADIIFGNYNPAGRLPITFYKSVNDLPEFDDYNMDNRTYKYFKGTPLFEFGYGLSYSTFKYSDLQINKEKIKVDEDIIISFTLSNISDINGEEVVQLYVKENGQREKMPLKVLKRFKRVLVKAGEKTEISFSIPTEELSHWDIAKQEFVVEQTEFEIQLGSSSSDIRLKHSIMME